MKAAVLAVGWFCRTETWHWPPQSRDENSGPVEWCDRRQQLPLMSLQQQACESDDAASNGMGWPRKNNASAAAKSRTTRVGI